ncbi:hypothetical protein SMACR_06160 [Sordaria macrospora]|uniref:WGS project CABT00000000 data, contig 2.33 n=2 Tax=Sordaria macrospora TaxID=5147 RepID=F7W679_SORMK|nr:uncharacterized protein SMAC_06160 [Sordaria macrospora k-hell]KAA8633395.1 hypothetical protein SMACR_06160 [Sordaria macrospora]WPJ66980.1 hypothetical protein SMAC4_06160 [Sordaria macrospora]CCC13017.1 unnamed protein product [Sordaria macrospora k-hell]
MILEMDEEMPQDYYPDEKPDNPQRSSPWDDVIPPDFYPDEKRGNIQRFPRPYDDAIPQDSYPHEKQDNFHRLPAPYDDAIPQDGDDESLPEYNPYQTKQEEEQQTFHQQPTTTSTPACTGMQNVTSSYDLDYYLNPRDSHNFVTQKSRSFTPPLPPPLPAKSVNQYEYNSDEDPSDEEPSYQNPRYQDQSYENPSNEDPSYDNLSYENPNYEDPSYEEPSPVSEWARGEEEYGGLKEEDVWEEEYAEEEQQQQEGGTEYRQYPRIVSGISSLEYYSEALRPVSAVSTLTSHYSHYPQESYEERISKRWTPISEVRPPQKWGNERYKTVEQGDDKPAEYGWL